MAVIHMKRSEGREGDFPTECGAVGNVRIATTWEEVTCNNCIRKFGPKEAKERYIQGAKERGLDVQTPEEKQEDDRRLILEGLLNNVRSQQLRLEGTKISVQAMMTQLAEVDEESVAEVVLCAEYIDAALNNLRMIKSMLFTVINGPEEVGQ